MKTLCISVTIQNLHSRRPFNESTRGTQRESRAAENIYYVQDAF